jgi:trk system potassium uptake protein
MNIIILGCGRTGSTIATSLDREGHKVSIIDRRNDAFRRLGPEFSGNKIVGNGIDEAVLKKAGIEKADAFVAVTNGDNTNIMSVQIAKTRFNVQKVVSRIKDPIRACAYRELGIETICTTMIGARVMKDYIMGKDLGPIGEYCALSDDEVVL